MSDYRERHGLSRSRGTAQLIVLTLLLSLPLKASGSGNAMTIYASQEVQIAITDAGGKRVGYVGGAILQEIPGAAYFDEQIKDDNPSLRGDHSVPLHHVLSIPYPQNGLYTLTITGMTAGQATIEIYRNISGGNPQAKQLLNALITVPGQTITQSVRYSTLVGDLNGDGKVDCADVAIVRAALGKKLGQAGYDPVADTNLDGVVDVRDLAFVSQKLPTGTRCQ